MRAWLFAPALAAGLLSLSGCYIEDFSGPRVSRDFHFSYPLAADGKVVVEGFNGGIEISGWDENTVDISGTKQARSEQALDDLQVNIDHTPASVTIRAQHSSTHHNESVRFILKVPRKAVLDRITTSNGGIRVADGAGPATLHTSNGAIHIEDLRGSLEAKTSNGAIDARLDSSPGPVKLETSNGSVQLRLPAKFDDEVRVHTSNGSITVRAPEDLNARVTARTSNSKITSDFEVRSRGEISRHRLEGTIGAGGPLLDLSTSNGSIHITR
jgi:DUF4097 and DUF4098 domain-containing protein YvlB